MGLGKRVCRPLQKTVHGANRLGVTAYSDRIREIFRTQLYLSQNTKKKLNKKPKHKKLNKSIEKKNSSSTHLIHPAASE